MLSIKQVNIKRIEFKNRITFFCKLRREKIMPDEIHRRNYN